MNDMTKVVDAWVANRELNPEIVSLFAKSMESSYRLRDVLIASALDPTLTDAQLRLMPAENGESSRLLNGSLSRVFNDGDYRPDPERVKRLMRFAGMTGTGDGEAIIAMLAWMTGDTTTMMEHAAKAVNADGNPISLAVLAVEGFAKGRGPAYLDD